MEMNNPIKLETFQGHIVLLCKGHYINKKNDNNDFFENLKKIWSVRCGYDYNPNDNRVLEYIADDMFEIICNCKRINSEEKIKYFMDVLHKAVADNNGAWWKPKEMSPIKTLIWEYRTLILHLQVNNVIETEGRKKHKITIPIVKLPKPMKQVFYRILNGNGRFKDYDKITKANKDE